MKVIKDANGNYVPITDEAIRELVNDGHLYGEPIHLFGTLIDLARTRGMTIDKYLEEAERCMTNWEWWKKLAETGRNET